MVDVSHTVGNSPDRAKGSNIPLASGDGGVYNMWNTMGRLPATGRILCPLGQGTARPGPEFARGTGLARGSYGLHGASVWEAVKTLAQQVPWHRLLDRVTVVLVRHGNGVSRDGDDDGNCDSLEDIGKAVSRVGSRWVTLLFPL